MQKLRHFAKVKELATLNRDQNEPPKCPLRIQRLCYHQNTRFFNRFFQKCKPVSRDLFFSFRNHSLSFIVIWTTSFKFLLSNFMKTYTEFYYFIWSMKKKVSELLQTYLSLKNTLLFRLHIKLDVLVLSHYRVYFRKICELQLSNNPDFCRSRAFFSKK